MESEKFDLVFSGQILPRQDLAVVKANMAALFKISSAQVDGLFSGKSIVLKRGVDLTAANRYRVAIKKAGARVELIKAGAEPALVKAAAAAESPGQPQALSGAPTQPVESVAEAAPQAKTQEAVSLEVLPVGEGLLEHSNQHDTAVVNVPDFEVLESGSDILEENERTHFEPLELDLSAISVREVGNLIDEAETMAPLPVLVADMQAEILPVGSDLLSATERSVIVTADIADLDLDIAPVGTRLEHEKPPAPPSPNVDHIQLTDT